MKKYKQLIIGFIVGALLFNSISVLAENKSIEVFLNNIKITIDGKQIEADAEPFMYSGKIYIPVGIVAKAFEAEVKWNEIANTVEITKAKQNTPIATSNTVTTPETTPQPTEKKEITVYITKTGSKYHSSGCRYLSKSKIPISLDAAKRLYSPCSVCNPPR